MNKPNNRLLGDILLDEGLITQSQLSEALAEQKRTLKKLGEVLVSLSMVSDEDITLARSIQLDVGYVNLQEKVLDPELTELVTESVARDYKLLPIDREGSRLVVAMANPMDIEAIDLIQFETKCRVEPVLATESKLMEAINRQYGNHGSDDLQQYMQEAALGIDDNRVDVVQESSEDIDDIRRQSLGAPMVRMVNLIIARAVRKKASDIHIEPRRHNVDVRYRVDGELHLVRTIPASLRAALASRLKIMAELDISERRLPQDGRITVKIDGRNVDLRVSTTPILYGERIVLRILDRMEGQIPLESLGFSSQDFTSFKRLISYPHGIILVTGPTGSGKTTTLYAALNMIKSEQTNIMTVEDPVEYELDGVNQTNVHHKIGLDFATQLRSLLRQDPDVILVGEIRDTETADVAFRAALTGHLVLSTLHCNSAPAAITRLLDMGLEPFLVSSAINGVTGQRLVRCLCPDCKEPYLADDDTLRILGISPGKEVTLYRPVGCTKCDNTGYSGRTSICETMVMDEEIRQLALMKASSADILFAAMKAGMSTMSEDGLRKILAGITSLEEVKRKVLLDSDMVQAALQRRAA